MKIYGYITDNGDGSSGLMLFKTQEDRDKQIEYDEANDHVVDEAEQDIDTDNIQWDEPSEIEENEEDDS